MLEEVLTLDPELIPNYAPTGYSACDVSTSDYIVITPDLAFASPWSPSKVTLLSTRTDRAVTIKKLTFALSYSVSFYIFLLLSLVLGGLILLSATKGTLFINPNFLFYGFLFSIGLAATAFAGMKSTKAN